MLRLGGSIVLPKRSTSHIELCGNCTRYGAYESRATKSCVAASHPEVPLLALRLLAVSSTRLVPIRGFAFRADSWQVCILLSRCPLMAAPLALVTFDLLTRISLKKSISR